MPKTRPAHRRPTIQAPPKKRHLTIEATFADEVKTLKGGNRSNSASSDHRTKTEKSTYVIYDDLLVDPSNYLEPGSIQLQAESRSGPAIFPEKTRCAVVERKNLRDVAHIHGTKIVPIGNPEICDTDIVKTHKYADLIQNSDGLHNNIGYTFTQESEERTRRIQAPRVEPEIVDSHRDFSRKECVPSKNIHNIQHRNPARLIESVNCLTGVGTNSAIIAESNLDTQHGTASKRTDFSSSETGSNIKSPDITSTSVIQHELDSSEVANTGETTDEPSDGMAAIRNLEVTATHSTIVLQEPLLTSEVPTSVDLLSAAVSSSGIFSTVATCKQECAIIFGNVDTGQTPCAGMASQVNNSNNCNSINKSLTSQNLFEVTSYLQSSVNTELPSRESRSKSVRKVDLDNEVLNNPAHIGHMSHHTPRTVQDTAFVGIAGYCNDDGDSVCTDSGSDISGDTTTESDSAEIERRRHQPHQWHQRQHQPTNRLDDHRLDNVNVPSTSSSLEPSQESTFVDVVRYGDAGGVTLSKAEKKARFVSRRTCDYCGKVCFKPSDLQRHLLVHTGERPHKCEFCSRAFKSKGSLLYHRRVNHEASDTSLSVCLQEKYLRHKESLARRMRKAHDHGETPYKILRSHLERTSSPRPSLMNNRVENLLSFVGGSKIDLENSIAYQTFAPLMPNGDAETPLDSLRQAVASQHRTSGHNFQDVPKSKYTNDSSKSTSTPVTSPLLGLATVASSLHRITSNDNERKASSNHLDDKNNFSYEEKWYKNISDAGYPNILKRTLEQKKCWPCSETGICPGHCPRNLQDNSNNNNNNGTYDNIGASIQNDSFVDNKLEEEVEKKYQNDTVRKNDSCSLDDECKTMTNLTETKVISLIEGLDDGHYVSFHKCHLCGKYLSSVSKVKEHLTDHAITWRRCPLCGVTFKFRGNLLAHLTSDHGLDIEALKPESLLHPEHCSREDNEKCTDSLEIVHNVLASHSHINNLLNPQRKQSKRREGIFKCRFCRKTFFRLYCLQRHERVHTGVKTCFCRKCGRGFSELRNLRHHILRFHAGLERSELIKLLSNGSGPKKSETESICKKFIITSSQVAKQTMAAAIDSTTGSGLGAKDKSEQPHMKTDFRKDLPVFYPDLYLTTSYPLSVASMSASGYSDMTLPHHVPPVSVFDRGAPSIFPVMDYTRYHSTLLRVKSASTISSNTNTSTATGVLISPTRLTPLHHQYLSAAAPHPSKVIATTSTSPDTNKPDSRSQASSTSPSPTDSELKKKGNNFSKHSSRYKSRLDIVRDAVKTEAAYQPVMSLDGRSVYKCPYCPKTFVGASDLTRHLNFHADLRPYKCELCEYSAKTNSQLKVHMRRHQGIREFKCTLCNYEGVTRSDLNRHFRSQTHINLSVEKQFQGLETNCINLVSLTTGKTCADTIVETGMDLSKWRQQSTSNHYSKHQFRCAACDFDGQCQDDLRLHLLSEIHLTKMVEKHDIKEETPQINLVEKDANQQLLIDENVIETRSADACITQSAGPSNRHPISCHPDLYNDFSSDLSDGASEAFHCRKGRLNRNDFHSDGSVMEETCEENDTVMSEKPCDHHENSDTEEEQISDPVIVIDG